MPFDTANQSLVPRPAPLPEGARVAVVGSGIAGLSAAWHLSQTHNVTVFEADDRFGGHSNTVVVDAPEGPVAIDTGFIVYNEANYPNLVALFQHLDVEIADSDMSFAVSMRDRSFEYSGQSLAALFATPASSITPNFFWMLSEVPKFHRVARRAVANNAISDDQTLGDFVREAGLSERFVTDFLQPMAGAIWSSPSMAVLDYPAPAFLRFFANHGLLQVFRMPEWQTVRGGSRHYVEKIMAASTAVFRKACPVVKVDRENDEVKLTAGGETTAFDAVVFACHGDTAAKLVRGFDAQTDDILGRFSYARNRAVLHTNPDAMPERRRVWSSWNVVQQDTAMTVSYWMNRLQPLETQTDYFVTLNPHNEIGDGLAAFDYDHPQYDHNTLGAQKEIWTVQGRGGVYFAGAHLGAGFHEDGIQSGLAVAELISGHKRPWSVEKESARLYLPEGFALPATPDATA